MISFQTVDVGGDIDQLSESLESIQITWLTGLSALAVLVAGILLARLARRSIRALGERTELASPQLFTLASRIAFYSIVFYSLGAALGFLGFEVIPLLSMLGLATVVLVLGLRPFFENFAAGITLQTRRPFDNGDQVLLGEHEGTVRDVNARTVVMESISGELVHIPNRLVLDKPIVNYTAVEARRSTLDVGLAYGSDLGRAEEVLRTAVQATAGVAADPPVQVFVHTFDSSTINAAVWFWHAPEIANTWAVRHQAAIDLKGALDEAGITIAFPQRVLWWGEEGPDESRSALG